MEIFVNDLNKNFVDTRVNLLAQNLSWHMTFTYGCPDRESRAFVWDQLKSVKGTHSHPWVCLGDFNAILSQEKKIGGSQVCFS